MQTSGRVALVTGGNRGLGFEVCRQLGRQGLKVVLSGRNEPKVREAAETLRAEGLDVTPLRLDVTDPDSIAAAERAVRLTMGRLDALVNNAGIALDESSGTVGLLKARIEMLETTLETNLFGPIRVCQAFVPLMKEGGYGRIVNLASRLASLTHMSTGSETYRISKTALNAVTRILAAELKGTNILVNSASPGWVRTAMGGPNAPLSPAEGADTIVWLATLPDDGPTGGFFQARHPMPW